MKLNIQPVELQLETYRLAVTGLRLSEAKKIRIQTLQK